MKRFGILFSRVAPALLAIVLPAIPATCHGDVNLDVSMDVTGLRANTYGAGAPYSIDFFMTGGQGNNDSVTISHFTITAASLGSSMSTPSVSGSLTSKLIVGDNTAFDNDFNQVITPDLTSNSVRITFQMDVTTNFASASRIPDNFAVSILDQTGTPIPTTDTFASTLLNFDLKPGLTSSQVSVFQSTGTSPVIGPPTVSPPTTATPELSTFVMFAMGAVGMSAFMALRSRSTRPK